MWSGWEIQNYLQKIIRKSSHYLMKREYFLIEIMVCSVVFFSNICTRKGKGLGKRPALVIVLKMLSFAGCQELERLCVTPGMRGDWDMSWDHQVSGHLQITEEDVTETGDPGQGCYWPSWSICTGPQRPTVQWMVGRGPCWTPVYRVEQHSEEGWNSTVCEWQQE